MQSWREQGFKTMMFLFDNRYQEKNALARRPSVAIQSP